MVEKVQETRLYQWLKERESKFLPQVDVVVNYTSDMLPLINSVFTNYTVHGIKHSINVLIFVLKVFISIGGKSIDKANLEKFEGEKTLAFSMDGI